jgi:hypothetical protein
MLVRQERNRSGWRHLPRTRSTQVRTSAVLVVPARRQRFYTRATPAAASSVTRDQPPPLRCAYGSGVRVLHKQYVCVRTSITCAESCGARSTRALCLLFSITCTLLVLVRVRNT